ncbi:MAG: hypothetical protein K0Q78_1093 [Cellvibrio sp.]|jgi:hypothetical protein|nr:hypothetical protein [Cellvibrio sp.]
MVRGVMDLDIDFSGSEPKGGWNDWSTGYELEESFREHESNHLRSGEWVRIVVINRATGYMGTRRVQLNEASQNDKGMMSTPVEEIVLSPPNLKIWAERTYEQKYGLEKNKEQINVIGAEGGALTDDKLVTVYTEWYDEEGRPLPSGLGEDNGEQFGFTGRMARVIGSGQIGEVGVVGKEHLAQFPIMPGRQTQVLHIKSNLTAAEHFYIHVSGTAKDESPQFDSGNTTQALTGRPAGLAPFLTPLYDENQDWKAWSAWNQVKRAYDAELLDEEPTKPLPSYVWSYRPEYQFSQFGLEMESILREYTDEAGQKNSQELLLDQAIDNRIPTIRSNDDLVSIFYSLFQQQHERLTPVDGEQELVFSLGANEVKATVSSNGELRFDNLAHLDLIDPTDLLTLRLYLNHDAGNTLWEWAFTRNGLHVYYSVPGNGETRNGTPANDIEILSLLDDEKTQPEAGDGVKAPIDPKVRTLGGMRLRYRYIQPSMAGLEVTKVTWKFAHDGRYCTQYGVEATTTCVKRTANVPFVQESHSPAITERDWSVYWEPLNGDNVDWSNWAGTGTDDAGVAANLKAEYTLPVNDPSTLAPRKVPRVYTRDFTVHTRELKPETDAAKVMKGSDVAMLEAMLWNIGMSPSTGPGIVARRIAAKIDRLEFKDSNPSVGKMVGRFNYVSFGPVAKISSVMHTGNVHGEQMIPELGRHWVHYMRAYDRTKQADVKFTDLDYETELKPAEAVWDGKIDYPDGVSFADIDKTFTDVRYESVKSLSGGNFLRSDILKAMAQMEAQGKHQENFRMIVGGGDEAASKGLNQIQNKYAYGSLALDAVGDGAALAVKEVSAYSATGESRVNHYDVRHNIIAKAMWLSVPAGGFYKAFRINTSGSTAYAGTYTWTSANPLKKIKTGTVSTSIATTATSHIDDDYELLAKGLGAYNQGAKRFSGGNGNSWINMLINRVTPKSKDFTDIKAIKYGNRTNVQRDIFANSEAMRYAISIMHDSDKLKLEYRTYIWKGGKYPKYEMDDEGNVKKDAADQPILHPKSEQDWCFAYGESEWMAGKLFSAIKENARGDALAMPPKLPIGRIDCTSGTN